MKLRAIPMLTPLMAGVGLILGAIPLTASSAVVPNPVTGDIYLAFRASGGVGGTTSYLVKLGVDTSFTTASANSSFTVPGLGAIGQDLTDTFGENWNTRSDVHWAIFSYKPNNGSAVLYASRPRPTAVIGSQPWPGLSLTERNNTLNSISPVIEGIGGYKGSLATANSLVATFQLNSNSPASYNKQVSAAGTTDFGSLSGWTSIEGNFGKGDSATVLDLYKIYGLGDTPIVARVGAFSITSSGTINFTNVPPISPTLDTDQDGVTDVNESIAGTDPEDGTDFFHVQSVTSSEDGVHVNFNVIGARTYTVEYSETLAEGSWSPVDTYAADSADLREFIDTDPARLAKARGFYRVKVSQ